MVYESSLFKNVLDTVLGTRFLHNMDSINKLSCLILYPEMKFLFFGNLSSEELDVNAKQMGH